MQRHLMLLATTVLVLHGLPANAQDGPVQGKEIQETWVGKDLTGSTPTGVSVRVRLAQDGKVTLSAGNTNDTGTWRVADNGYCTTWKSVRPGQERCFTVARAGSTFKVSNPDGSLSGTFTSIK